MTLMSNRENNEQTIVIEQPDIQPKYWVNIPQLRTWIEVLWSWWWKYYAWTWNRLITDWTWLETIVTWFSPKLILINAIEAWQTWCISFWQSVWVWTDYVHIIFHNPNFWACDYTSWRIIRMVSTNWWTTRWTISSINSDWFTINWSTVWVNTNFMYQCFW